MQQKLKVARDAATIKAQDEKKTVAIWKEASEYKFGDPASAGGASIIEFIFFDS